MGKRYSIMHEQIIWDFFIEKIKNPYGVAGLIGNLYAESGLNPKNLQNTFEKKLNYTDESYTLAVDNNSYKNFINDGAGYGIAQWTYSKRKENLLNFAHLRQSSIGDLQTQLDFLWQELQSYTSVLNILYIASSIDEASNIVLTKFEKPKDQSEQVKNKRIEYSKKYYNAYSTKGVENNMAIDFNKYIMSTGTHYISNSGSDENKQYKGGTAGDQTGHEWELKKWYNRPWSVVLRYPNQQVALKIAELGIAAALNNKIGYDQNQRTTYWTQLKAANYDPSKITVACEEDCTAGVSANVRAAGYIFNIQSLKDIPICSSRNMRSEFTKAGFQALTDSKYLTSSKYLLPGDILLYENHHAATNITCGANVRNNWRPQSDNIPEIKPEESIDKNKKYILITGSVNIRKGPSTEYGTLGTAKDGDKLLYWDRQFDNGWYLVEYKNQLGAVSNKYGQIAQGG